MRRPSLRLLALAALAVLAACADVTGPTGPIAPSKVNRETVVDTTGALLQNSTQGSQI